MTQTAREPAGLEGAALDPSTRILICLPDFSGGGAEREGRALTIALAERGFNVSLALWRDVFDYPTLDSVPVTILNKRRPWHWPRTIVRLSEIVDRLRPDLVFSQPHYVTLATGLALTMARRRPAWVCRFAGNPNYDIPPALRRLYRIVSRRADIVSGCCEKATEALGRRLKTSADRLMSLPNVIDAAVLNASAPSTEGESRRNEVVVFHAGRLTPQKNQLLLIDAFAGWNEPRARLQILGQGPLRGAIERRIERHRLRDRVSLLGFSANPWTLMSAADVVVLSSDYEGMPNVVIEAMAMGKPVIATRCPFGPDELIEDRVHGLLVPTRDPAALSEAMKTLALDVSLARRLGAAAQSRVRSLFDPNRVLAMYLHAFARALRYNSRSESNQKD